MAWKLKSPPKTVRVTTRLAAEFAKLDSIRQDRPLSERRLTVYRRMVDNNGFRPVSWAKAFCVETGQYYRVNGQHTSTLFSGLEKHRLENLYAVVEDYTCDTIEDVAHLYSTFDSQQQTRSASDINRAFASSIEEFSGWLNDIRFINLLVAGIAYRLDPGNTLNKTGATHRTQAERAEQLFEHIAVCQWLREMLHGDNRSNAQKLYRAPVVAAMIGSWEKSRSDADKFWTAVRDETGTSPELPDRKLGKFLLVTRANQGARNVVPRRFRVETREYFVKSIRAWNAWRASEPTNLKYSVDDKIPSFR